MESNNLIRNSTTSEIQTPSSLGSEEDLITAASSLCSEFFKQASDPKTVLTNPKVVNHLRKIHNKATLCPEAVEEEDEKEELRAHLEEKIAKYNKHVQQSSMRDLSYFGPIRFYRHGVFSGDCHNKLLNLKDSDTVGDIMKELKEKFEISTEQKCNVREIIQGDEILLDATERPLQLAVNSPVPVSFHVYTAAQKNVDLLKNLAEQNLTPYQHKKLMEKFNFDESDRSSSSGYRAASVSSTMSDSLSHFDSLTDSINSKTSQSKNSLTQSDKKADSIDRKKSFLKTKLSSDKQKNGNNITRHQSQNKPFGLKPKVKKTKSKNSNSPEKSKKPNVLTTTERRGRESTRSASARKLFQSLRKSSRGRSGSRERASRGKSPLRNSNYNSDSEDRGELSSDVSLPGILKIFGDAVCPGANYKSVLATRQSNAKELVKTALERYGVSKSKSKSFVLCEVVGRIKPNSVKRNSDITNNNVPDSNYDHTKPDFSRINNFIEDYVRPLNDHEKPLILQSYWKPLDGYARRFEIRRKSKVQDNNEQDTETQHVNAQAKRLIIQKSRIGNSSSVNDVRQSLIENDDDASSDSEVEENRVLERKPLNEDKVTEMKSESTSSLQIPTPQEFADDTEKSDAPYLMTLQGESGIESLKSDNLIHRLSRQSFTIGGEKYSENNNFDIKLKGDIASHCNCVINCTRIEPHKENFNWNISISTHDNKCSITANGSPIAKETKVTGGAIIVIADQYIFMLKDPTCDKQLSNSVRFSFGVGNDAVEGHRTSAFTPVVKKKKILNSEINFEAAFSDRVLDAILVAAQDILATNSEVFSDGRDSQRQLSPAKLICYSIEHACLNFHEEEKKELLYKVASKLQSLVLDTTASVSELQNDEKIKDPDDGINYLLPRLRPVVFWMSNALEIFSFLQTDIENVLEERIEFEKKLNDKDNGNLEKLAGFQVSEDILAVLEEIVMYAFQQLVYYLTKTLYGALPSLLDSNPFADVRDDDSLFSRGGTSRIIAIYEAARGLTQTFGVHKDIETQLFAYLFFFTSISLFNTLMSDDSAPRYYRWDKGVQIRGNLEEIETWAIENGFQEQSSIFLSKFSTLTSLLATPRSQMLKGSWSIFRRDFKQLHPSQLKQVLDKYQIPSSKQRPAAWIPDSDDLEESSEDQYLMESYDNHPPLVLPGCGSQLDLKEIATDDWFIALKDFITAVGTGKNLSVEYKKGNETSSEAFFNNNNEEFPRLGHTNAANMSDVSSQASRTESEINNNIQHEKLIPNEVIIPDYIQSSPLHVIMDTLSQTSYEYDENQMNYPSPIAAPRRGTPVPSPRHFTVPEKNTSSDSRLPNGNNGISMNGLHSPDRNIAQILLQNAAEHHQQPKREKNGSPEKFVGEKLEDNELSGMQILPLHTIDLKHSEITRRINHAKNDDISAQVTTADGTRLMPNEVFVVDLLKGKNGLGLGLVDGMYTSLKINGIFVRSLIPDGPNVKHTHMKHQEVIKCWLQDGRLQLGDRILAVNGQSLLTADYKTSIKILRQSSEKMRFLVGRCGPEVALKITTSSC